MSAFFKTFENMTEDDYNRLGLMAGLEIHQQLLTEKKLFCRCPAGKYTREYDAEILRHMRPTLSELGEYDGTALMEFKTKKNITYRINHESVCTYEMDDTPPFEINEQALDISLEIAMLMNYKLVDEIHIARKQYLDGSIPTGFQRTTIVGVDGWIPYKNRKIDLIQLGLEEDACREISDIGHERIYITDRLGMPLIETVTQPQMKTPQEVAEVAEILRRLVRSTGKVRTGIGAGRQDVNVSISGGTRIEIKGVSRIPTIPMLIYNEAMRQHSLLRIREKLHHRGITKDTIKTESADVTHLLNKTAWDPIRRAIKHGDKVYCVNLKGFQGILSHPTQTGKVFSREISDRVRVVACLTRLPNILTSESTEETIDSFAGKKIRNAVNANSNDGLILIWGNPKDLTTAVDEIIIRAKEATIGVPSETRQALPDGTNGFERILPGPERMYPDTDLPPIQITHEKLYNLEKNIPEPIWKREEKYKNMGLPKHLTLSIAFSLKARFFEILTEKYKKIHPKHIAELTFEKTVAWKRKKLPVEKIQKEDWEIFLDAVQKQTPLLEKSDDIFTDFLSNEEKKLEQILSKYLLKTKIDPDEIIENILYGPDKKEINTIQTLSKKQRFIMGKIMEICRGQIAGSIINRKLQKHLTESK